MSKTYDAITESLLEINKDLEENDGKNLKIDIMSADTARQILLDQIIPEINEEIKDACKNYKNYIIYEFNIDGSSMINIVKYIINQYESKGYTIAKKDDFTYMISW